MVSRLINSPWPYKTEYERMAYELYNLFRNRERGSEMPIKVGDPIVKPLEQIRWKLRRGEGLDRSDEVIVKNWYTTYEKFLLDSERVHNPPEGHPRYFWPPGVKWKLIEEFSE